MLTIEEEIKFLSVNKANYSIKVMPTIRLIHQDNDILHKN